MKKRKQCSICGNTINLVEVKEQGYPARLVCQCCLDEEAEDEVALDDLKSELARYKKLDKYKTEVIHIFNDSEYINDLPTGLAKKFTDRTKGEFKPNNVLEDSKANTIYLIFDNNFCIEYRLLNNEHGVTLLPVWRR